MTIKAFNNAPSTEQLALVNENKMLEELVLRQIDRIANMPSAPDSAMPSHLADPRFLALARTKTQEGFMAFNRAIMQPGRIDGDLSKDLPTLAFLCGLKT
jgi:hypothetical protein